MRKFAILVLPATLVSCASVPAAPSSDGFARFGETTRAGQLLVRPDRLVEDSRCPADVQCVWAGRLVIEATVTSGEQQTAQRLTLGEQVAVSGGQLLLESAEPVAKAQGTTPALAHYRFQFTFSR